MVQMTKDLSTKLDQAKLTMVEEELKKEEKEFLNNLMLKSYVLTKPFVILTSKNLLPWVSSQMTMSSRISKWLMELQSYEYTFKVENSVRAQLAGILTYQLHEKVIKVPNVRPSPPPPKVLSNAYTLFFDGAFRRATGKLGGGLVLVNPEGEVVMKEQVTLDGSTSNNEAEYDVLISIWACKNERLRTKVTSIRKLFSQFEEVQLYHIPRKENEDANLLAQQAVSNQDKAHVVIVAIALKDPQYADVQHWCRSYHNCQVNGNKRLLYGPRQAIIANGPFEKWGIDAMGSLARTANGKLYILVAIDYMTRFGTLLEIVSDNGPGFRRGILTENLTDFAKNGDVLNFSVRQDVLQRRFCRRSRIRTSGGGSKFLRFIRFRNLEVGGRSNFNLQIDLLSRLDFHVAKQKSFYGFSEKTKWSKDPILKDNDQCDLDIMAEKRDQNFDQGSSSHGTKRVSHDEDALFKAQLVSFMETFQRLAKHPKMQELLQAPTQTPRAPS
ncbi:hypothetical protein L7F22_004894 [Adiantum nelumboides]|nr:hypothetical protein [Adiantum nelumboides]